MTLELLTRYWALLIASVLGVAILLFVLYRLYQASSRGRLNAHVTVLRKRKAEALKAASSQQRAEKRLANLRKKAERTKPKVISLAEERFADAESLKKIAEDQVLRAQKLVREVILEEFPPTRHDGLRNKYL